MVVRVTQPVPVPVAWKRSDPGSFKLNVDGSTQSGIHSGVGGLIRDSAGQLLHTFSSHYGNNSNVAAELFAIRDGLELCLYNGFLCIIIELDSLLACNLMHGQVRPL
ncbi:hypothetical protein ACH5RR_029833 [Cinchona calisaya]|uniref:RNase H type-1 domain-containing protein n=1 Tax=Cinchona calisaya TaxID=153742 RepID=A0ABD2YSV1_9GENT